MEQRYNKLKPANDHNKAYILDFMELIGKDVMVFYELLKEKEEIIKKQTDLNTKCLLHSLG